MYARRLANSFMLWCKPRTNTAIKSLTLGKIQRPAITPILFLGLWRPPTALTGFLVRIIHGIARNVHQSGATRA
jgi:hypothetical protein